MATILAARTSVCQCKEVVGNLPRLGQNTQHLVVEVIRQQPFADGSGAWTKTCGLTNVLGCRKKSPVSVGSVSSVPVGSAVMMISPSGIDRGTAARASWAAAGWSYGASGSLIVQHENIGVKINETIARVTKL